MLVKGKYIVTDPGRADGVIEDGAVYIEGNQIVATGPYRALAEQYPHEAVLGSDRYIVLPGLINAHDHGRGPSAFQLGIPDDYVELWLMALLGSRAVDPYLATAYANICAIESGVTTVLNSYYDPNLARDESSLTDTVRAYEDAGLRAVVALGILDQSPVTSLSERLLPALPTALQSQLADFLSGRPSLPVEEFLAVFRAAHEAYNGQASSLIRLLLGPVSVHWCSEELLIRIRDEAEATGAGIQAHVLETIYQRDEALRHHGQSMIAWLDQIDFLSPRLSCAHCVWVDRDDIERLAASGASVVHNPSSNLRLGSGIAPLNRMLRSGVNVALGMDSHSLNDNGDMLQEMRLAAHLHRIPGAGANHPTAADVLAMATRNGARALLLDDEVGRLVAGQKADLILMRLDTFQFPFVDPGQDPVDTILIRATARDVETVIVDGRIIMQDRKILTLDKEAIVSELQAQLKAAPSEWTDRFRQLMARLKPYADEYYHRDADRQATSPYLLNS